MKKDKKIRITNELLSVKLDDIHTDIQELKTSTKDLEARTRILENFKSTVIGISTLFSIAASAIITFIKWK